MVMGMRSTSRPCLALWSVMAAGLTSAALAQPWSIIAEPPADCASGFAPSESAMRAYLARVHAHSSIEARAVGTAKLEDRASALEHFAQLGDFAAPPTVPAVGACSTALCAAEAHFGPGVGLRLLYLRARYGYNGSHLAHGATEAWSRRELDEVLSALGDVAAAIPARRDPLPLVKDNGSAALGPWMLNGDLTIIARADYGIRLAPIWSVLPPGQRRAAIVHELAHNILDNARASGLADHWRNATGVSVSGYGATNAAEDFAESVVAYRYRPATLKAVSLPKYRLLRDEVFGGTEFASTRACRGEHRLALPVPGRTLHR